MSNDLERQVQVQEQQWQHDFDELAGRTTPPDRVDAILQRVAVPSTSTRPFAWRGPRLWVAALVLLGLTATIGVSMLARGSEPGAGESPGALATAGAEDPKPWSTGQGGAVRPVPDPDSPAQPASKPPPDRVVPKGADPADLAAIRSAEAMLEAERKLAQRIREGKITGFDEILPFGELSDWTYEDGLQGMPESIKKQDGQKVLLTGFMLPIDEVENIQEFLLVQSLWSCCYGQPPGINGIVRCVMPEDMKSDYLFDPLKVIGTFRVEATMMDGYCVDVYQLHVDSLETIQ